MDSHILRLLEMGAGIMLFALGLALFLTMNNRTLDYIHVGEGATEGYEQHQVVDGSVSESYYTKEAIYMLLTDSHMQAETNLVGGVTYGTGDVGVYIDGVSYPPVSDYQDRQSLSAALATLTATAFDIDYTIDEDGDLSEIHFTSK